jgi:hypothetical protein
MKQTASSAFIDRGVKNQLKVPMKPFFLTCAAFALCICSSPQLSGQTANLSATVQFSNGQTLAIDDFSDPIGVQPNEIVSVTIQFDPSQAGEAIKVEPLDGGRVTSKSSVVSEQGVAAFSFQADTSAGQNRVMVRHGSETLPVQFRVLSSNPQNNPPVITPANPEG